MAAVSSWGELQQRRSNADFLIFLHASGSRQTALRTSSFVTWKWSPRWGEDIHYCVKSRSHTVWWGHPAPLIPTSARDPCPEQLPIRWFQMPFWYLMKWNYTELSEDLFTYSGKEWRTPEGMENRERKRDEKAKMREVAMQLAFLSHLDLLAWPHLDELTCSSTAWCNLHCPAFDFSPCAGWPHI